MIDANAYCITYKLKKPRVFAVFMKDLEYQANKNDKSRINLKVIVPKKQHDFLNIFFKKDSDIFFLYEKYDPKIILKKK